MSNGYDLAVRNMHEKMKQEDRRGWQVQPFQAPPGIPRPDALAVSFHGLAGIIQSGMDQTYEEDLETRGEEFECESGQRRHYAVKSKREALRDIRAMLMELAGQTGPQPWMTHGQRQKFYEFLCDNIERLDNEIRAGETEPFDPMKGRMYSTVDSYEADKSAYQGMLADSGLEKEFGPFRAKDLDEDSRAELTRKRRLRTTKALGIVIPGASDENGGSGG